MRNPLPERDRRPGISPEGAKRWSNGRARERDASNPRRRYRSLGARDERCDSVCRCPVPSGTRVQCGVAGLGRMTGPTVRHPMCISPLRGDEPGRRQPDPQSLRYRGFQRRRQSAAVRSAEVRRRYASPQGPPPIRHRRRREGCLASPIERDPASRRAAGSESAGRPHGTTRRSPISLPRRKRVEEYPPADPCRGSATGPPGCCRTSGAKNGPARASRSGPRPPERGSGPANLDSSRVVVNCSAPKG